MTLGENLATARTTGFRTNVRDPLVERMIGPGKAFEFAEVEVAGRPQQVFRGAPRNLAGLYRQAVGYGSREMIVQDDLRMTFDEAFAQAAGLADALRETFGIGRGR